MPENRDIEPRDPDDIERRKDSLIRRSLEYLKEFEEQGLANVEEPDLEDWDLHRAAKENRADIALLLITAGADIEAEIIQERRAPIHNAAQQNKVDKLRLLLDQGVYPDARDEVGNTPLIYAATGGSTNTAKLLLQKGANVNAANNEGKTPLLSSLWTDSNLFVVRLLIDNGANIEVQDRNGNRPLLIAAENSAAQIIKLLISNGAKVDAKNNLDQTALQKAKTIEVIGILIASGAKNASDTHRED